MLLAASHPVRNIVGGQQSCRCTQPSSAARWRLTTGMTGSWVGAPPCHHHVSGTGVSGVPVGGPQAKMLSEFFKPLLCVRRLKQSRLLHNVSGHVDGNFYRFLGRRPSLTWPPCARVWLLSLGLPVSGVGALFMALRGQSATLGLRYSSVRGQNHSGSR